MIVITGTKRSGTSMWMQVLKAAGIETLGPAFMGKWESTIKDANKRGFYETHLRRGIYYATNPHPETGTWLPPKSTRSLGVKIFIPGVVRSDVAYLTRVVASVRPYRQFAASLNRLYAMEEKAREEQGKPPRKTPRIDPVLEWWVENFLLLRDVTTRRYPVRLISYESMIEDPAKVCDAVFDFIGMGDADAAAAAVHPEDRTQQADSTAGISHPDEELFDDYHHRVKTAKPFDEPFFQKLNETHLRLLPELEAVFEEMEKSRAVASKEGARGQKGSEAPEPRAKKRRRVSLDRLDALFHPEDPSPESHSS
jgi:hypothetical protein